MKIEKNRVVTLTYELRILDENGEPSLVETANEEQPMVFIHGMSGLPEQFEDKLEGLNTGDDFDFKLDTEDGYGDVNEEAVVDLPKNVFEVEGSIPDNMLEKGNYIPMTDSEGNQLQGRVVEVKDDAVTMDFNHPLAGKELFFKGKVKEVREATPEELDHGHVHGEGGHHH
ncbi:FKBP-type peptidyl-prolyl cis-trans isomerase SlyD [Pontibacter ummariensis]|uniref:Peptidyl-prolyl cis-trans isomerase n=1 Tax=Pontibacter ummariensis TaxID=1610492 RepID=A0A239BPH1_9BACT|nr:FKBP-type peptidyl-prolyl cis-trans isomerase [Pontibacter ummariensis]PRY15691.1 FKBP-type peptidyl-prolyl cis-trans isomerase SlyD [Pontibacter ummariensis]SNS09930.1 FKBP-type peptidyl-prolyl cis-trans isomerase SlyD [Pontibacter ummariensis]